MQIIGITGRSGCGKSTLTDSIRAAGFRCVDADQVAREVLLPGSPCIVQLQQEFGADIVDKAGQVRRRLLLDLCTGLGVGITQRPKVKDPFRPGDGLQPGLQKGPGGSIRTDEESVVPFQFLHGGLGQRGLPGPVQVGGKLLPQHLRGLF